MIPFDKLTRLETKWRQIIEKREENKKRRAQEHAKELKAKEQRERRLQRESEANEEVKRARVAEGEKARGGHEGSVCTVAPARGAAWLVGRRLYRGGAE